MREWGKWEEKLFNWKKRDIREKIVKREKEK